MKVTQWFEYPAVPSRVGNYQYVYSQFCDKYIFDAYWTGFCFVIDKGYFLGNVINQKDGDKWRGLAEKP